MEIQIILFQLLLTFALALLFGLERHNSHKPVSFGAFVFVAVGSCSLAIVAVEIGNGNPTPLIGAIITGIGFLGAGALIKTTDKIFGFTTAASIWLFAIFGIMIGLNHYGIASLLYVFMWICVQIDKYMENEGIGDYQKKLSMKMSRLDGDGKIIGLFDKHKIKRYKLLSKKINKKEKFLSMNYLLYGSGKNIRDLLSEMQNTPNFIEFSLE